LGGGGEGGGGGGGGFYLLFLKSSLLNGILHKTQTQLMQITKKVYVGSGVVDQLLQGRNVPALYSGHPPGE